MPHRVQASPKQSTPATQQVKAAPPRCHVAPAAPGSNAPPLPDVSGPLSWPAPPHQPQLAWAPLSFIMVFSQIAELHTQAQQSLGNLRRSATLQASFHTRGGIDSQIDSIRGSRRAARNSLIGVGAAALLGPVASGWGGALSMAPQNWQQNAAGAGLQALGQALPALANPLVQWLDGSFSFGGKYAADQANIQKSMLDYLQRLAQTTENLFQGAHDNAKRRFDSVWEMLRQIYDLKHSTQERSNQSI